MNEFNPAGHEVREPSADQREGAKALRGWYLALIAEGFDENQALQIIGYQLGS